MPPNDPSNSIDTVGTTANVALNVYSMDALTDIQRHHWENLNDRLKLRVLDYHSAHQSVTASNITCIGLHETIAATLNRDEQVQPSITRIALGSGGATNPEVGDRELTNFVVSTDITEYQTTTTKTIVRGLIDTNQGNGVTLDEIGVLLGNGKLANHAATESIEKTNSETVTVRADLSVGDI